MSEEIAWRASAAYLYLLKCTAGALAWEYLRRNGVYQDQWRNGRSASRWGLLHRRGSCDRFPPCTAAVVARSDADTRAVERGCGVGAAIQRVAKPRTEAVAASRRRIAGIERRSRCAASFFARAVGQRHVRLCVARRCLV